MKDIGTHRYDHATVEKRWQECWEKSGLDKTDISSGKRPFYNLMMFPYPSAEGLHVGNMYAFTGSDIYGRFKRMQGYTVFEPIGLDGFGIHSENYSLKIGKHPMDHAKVTEKRFYGQLRQIGAMFDFSRTLNTYDPSYYRWTQWLFIQLFNRGLAYRGKASVNFCPSCKTVLADEQVLVQTREGVSTHVCERCGNEVEKRSLEQWFFKITAYAGKLLEDIPSLNWSDKVKVAQTNWIGKKQGISITYPVVTGSDKRIGEVTCFTTRPDTNFGATFVVLSPEHEFVKILLSADGLIAPEKKQEIEAYCRNASRKSEQDRMAEGRKKTGVDTGLYCLNQLNNKKLPLYISDFVLSGFGTGAVVGVPGHDVRDFQFAKEFRVPIVRVVVGTDGSRLPITEESQVQEDEGVMMDSGFLDGMDIHAATEAMMEYLEGKGWGKRTVTYHLRDWLISRQRYWGPPIPMIFCQACFDANKGQRPDMPGWYPVPEEQLPLVLPRIDDYKPSSDGIAPLSKHKEFFDTVCPSCGGHAVRETDVSDTFLDSSWYFLRYPCISSVSADSKPFDPGILRRWLPVHMYTGGAEHSVLHLLYSRYITMALSDMGYLEFQEPFTGFFAHGLIIKDGAKMSKSKGNIVNPDEYIAKYGADAVRLYLMFIGPFSLGGDFRDTGMEGMARWVNRVWKLLTGATSEEATSPASICVLMEKTIAKVTEDMEKRRYNTAIASLMEFTNAVADAGGALGKEEARKLILLIAPLAPHMAEELWSRLHGRGTYTNPTDSVHTQSWPSYDPTVLEKEDVSVIVQINGKLRDTLVMGTEAASRQDTVEERAKQSDRVRTYLFPADHPEGVSIVKVIFVPGKLINFVIR